MALSGSQVRVTRPSPRVAVSPVTAEGATSSKGVALTVADAFDSLPAPLLSRAVTCTE